MSASNQKAKKKRPPAKKPWKGAPSRLSATSATKAKTRAKIIAKLEGKYPDAHCALIHQNAYELLIATILSAQCTDERVNSVTAVLFPNYPSVKAMANAKVEDIEAIIRPTGFFRNKAKNIVACCKKLLESGASEIPRSLPELVALPGVGRKTANVVLGNAFGITSGVVVDTHVQRLANRLGWTKSKQPESIEQDLQKIIPKEKWILISHLLIWHGRKTCKARRPLCEQCILFDLCPKIGV